jgi:hypothetical protein
MSAGQPLKRSSTKHEHDFGELEYPVLLKEFR